MSTISISRDAIKAQGQSLPKLTKGCSLTSEPVWGDDAGRENMAGKYSGTFVGWFPKIKLPFGSTTIAEMNTIKKLIERPIITLTYPLDREYKGVSAGKAYTEKFYGTAITAEFDNYKGKYKPFNIELVAVERRLYD